MHTVHDVFHYCTCTNLSQIHNRPTQKLIESLHYFCNPWWWWWAVFILSRGGKEKVT